MSTVTVPGEAFGDLLLDQPRRCDKWSDYLTARVRTAAKDEVLAEAVPGLAAIAQRFIARLEALPDPARCIVHGDIYPPNVMMNDDLQVTGLIDFSFTTRVGDHVMDLAGACYYLQVIEATSQADLDYLKQLIPPCVREVVCCSTFLYFSGGRDRTMIWDIHWNENRRF